MGKSRTSKSSFRQRKPALGTRLFAILALLIIIMLALSALLPLVTTR